MSGPSDQAVVKYLDLPVPEANVARFVESTPGVHHAVAGQDTVLSFEVELFKDVPVSFAYSVEMMRIGVGWEVLLLGDRVHVASVMGKYMVDLAIDALPLPVGEYSLNVTLLQTSDVADGSADILDTRGWTNGNGFKLKVDGPKCSSTVVLPLNVDGWKD